MFFALPASVLGRDMPYNWVISSIFSRASGSQLELDIYEQWIRKKKTKEITFRKIEEIGW